MLSTFPLYQVVSLNTVAYMALVLAKSRGPLASCEHDSLCVWCVEAHQLGQIPIPECILGTLQYLDRNGIRCTAG